MSGDVPSSERTQNRAKERVSYLLNKRSASPWFSNGTGLVHLGRSQVHVVGSESAGEAAPRRPQLPADAAARRGQAGGFALGPGEFW